MSEPILVRSPLTGRIYIATRYKHLGVGRLVLHKKYDVTDQFMALVREMAEESYEKLAEQSLAALKGGAGDE